MGSKIQNIIFHMISYITVFALAFGSVLYTSAEEHPKMMEVTLNHTDLLNNFLDVSRLFYNGEFQGKFTANTEPYQLNFIQSNAYFVQIEPNNL